MIKSVGIVGMGTSIPEKILTNADLEKMVDTSDEWIRSRTGIAERRIIADGLSTSDLALEAAQKALVQAGMTADEVDLVIVASVSPDMIFPATACIVQGKLGAVNAAAFDLEAGCSGFLYVLTIAAQCIASGLYNNVLVIGAEAMSRLINWEDRNTCVLFGDAAAAAVLKPVEDGYGFLSFYLGSDGRGSELLLLPAGGARLPASRETVENHLHSVHMAGAEVFKFAVRIMGDASLEALKRANLTPQDIDLVVPHQANVRIIDAAAKRLGIDREKIYVNVERFGNTSSASVGVALMECVEQGLIKSGDIILLVGFGAGLTWGSAVIRWV